MGYGWIQITSDMLAELLCLPDGTEVLYAKCNEERWPLVLEIGVSHPDLPPPVEGAPLRITPTYRSFYDRRLEFVDWGLPKS